MFNLTAEQVEKLAKVMSVKDTETCSAANAKAVLIKAAVGTSNKPAFAAYWLNKAAEHPEWNIKDSVKETLKVSSQDILDYIQKAQKSREDAIESLDF